MGLKKRYELGKAALEAAVKKLKGTGAGKKMTNKQLKQRANQDAFDDARTARKEKISRETRTRLAIEKTMQKLLKKLRNKCLKKWLKRNILWGLLI